MTLANPYFLVILAAAAAIAWFQWTRRNRLRAPLFFSQTGILEKIPQGRGAAFSRFIPEAFKLLALLLAILALSRPQKVLEMSHSPSLGVDILLVLDTSPSMDALDFDPYNRLQAAKKNAREFIKHRPDDRIGIVVFGGHSFLQCPLTLDHGALLEFLDEVEVGMTRRDGTAIGDAIATAVNHVKDSQAKSKVIVLLTDGRHNAGTIDPVTAAKAAKLFGIKIHAIGTGARGPSLFPVQDPLMGRRLVRIQEDLDEGSLKEIAGLAGGQYFRATNNPELRAVYQRIDEMEKTELKAPPVYSCQDRYRPFLIPSLGLLLAGIVLGQTLFMRIP